jgi:very-short-patch-repair endonuclease
MSASEKILWNFLRKEQIGFKFRKQAPVLDFILDFYCTEAKVCVEVDGEQHSQQIQYDLARDQALGRAGILTIRIPSLDIFALPDKLGPWLQRVHNVCCERTGKTPDQLC